MAIIINLDVMMAKRKMRSKDLAHAINITEQNLSILKTGKARAIRFSTLEAICTHLNCQPGDILEFGNDDEEEEDTAILPATNKNEASHVEELTQKTEEA